MDHLERLSRYSLSEPDNVSILVLNYSADQFEKMFSRMEFVTAIRFITEISGKLSIPINYAVKEVSDNTLIRKFIDEKTPYTNTIEGFWSQLKRSIDGNLSRRIT